MSPHEWQSTETSGHLPGVRVRVRMADVLSVQPDWLEDGGFGERLRCARERAGLSVAQAADEAHVGRLEWQALESEVAFPTDDDCQAVAILLGVSPDWLVWG